MDDSLQLLLLIFCFLFGSYGVVSLPEVNDWQPLTVNDSYLVAATDGVFEKLNPQDICDIFWELHTDTSVSSELIDFSSYSLADRVVDAAFDRGSLDNMAAIVVPVKSFGTSQSLLKNVFDEAGEHDSSASGYIRPLNERPGKFRSTIASCPDLLLLMNIKEYLLPFLSSFENRDMLFHWPSWFQSYSIHQRPHEK